MVRVSDRLTLMHRLIIRLRLGLTLARMPASINPLA